jgi:hypothetical protein
VGLGFLQLGRGGHSDSGDGGGDGSGDGGLITGAHPAAAAAAGGGGGSFSSAQQQIPRREQPPRGHTCIALGSFYLEAAAGAPMARRQAALGSLHSGRLSSSGILVGGGRWQVAEQSGGWLGSQQRVHAGQRW